MSSPPVTAKVEVPTDEHDHGLTDEQVAGIELGLAQLDDGEGIPHEAAMAEILRDALEASMRTSPSGTRRR